MDNPTPPSIPQVPPQQASPVAPPPQSLFKKHWLLFLGGFVAIVIAGTSMYVLSAQKQAESLAPIPMPTHAIIPTPTDPTANWKIQSTKALSFKLPQEWWSASTIDSKFGIQSVAINPTPLAKTSNQPPTFMITNYSKITLDQMKTQSVYGLKTFKEEPLNIGSATGIKLSNFVDKKGDAMPNNLIVLLSYGSELYTFQQVVKTQNYEEIFNQILSTFKFTK